MLPVLIGVALTLPFAAYSFFVLHAYAFSLSNVFGFAFTYMFVATVSLGLFVWFPLRALRYLDTIIYARTRSQQAWWRR